jgi:hypothetical protein
MQPRCTQIVLSSLLCHDLCVSAYALPGNSSFSARPGELTQQLSKQQQPAQPLSASASFDKARSVSEGGKQQLQAKLSGKQKQAGPNQRFLKQYSLDKKGLFAP